MNNLEKEFVPYNLSLELKNLGFNEPCLGWYLPEIANKGNVPSVILASFASDWNVQEDKLNAPLYSQIFRWFRKIHKIQVFFDYFYYDGFHYGFTWVRANGDYGEEWCDNNNNPKGWINIKDAEIEALKKLIELSKQQIK